MSEHLDDALVSETRDRIRRAELATVLYPAGTPEHARAVERLDRATRQMRRLADAEVALGSTTGERGPAGRADR